MYLNYITYYNNTYFRICEFLWLSPVTAESVSPSLSLLLVPSVLNRDHVFFCHTKTMFMLFTWLPKSIWYYSKYNIHVIRKFLSLVPPLFAVQLYDLFGLSYWGPWVLFLQYHLWCPIAASVLKVLLISIGDSAC